MDYCGILILLAIMTSLVLIINVISNENFDRKTKKGFIITFILIIIGSVCEWLSALCNCNISGENIRIYIILRYLVKYSEFIIALIIPIVFLKIIFEFSKKYQNKNKIQLYSIIAFLFFGTLIQFINPNAKTYWISITIATLLFFIYYISIIQYVDGLTKLLNQKCYYTFLEQNTNKMFTILIFDVNNFKYINDNFGHNFGDKILADIGEIIKNEYGKYGKCYRIGGDEFAVIIEKNNAKIQKMNGKFKKAVKEKRKEIPEFPSVAFGMSTYNPTKKSIQNISSIVEEADAKMYRMKNEVKNMTMK